MSDIRHHSTQAVLAELPGQVADYYLKTGVVPKDAK